MYACGPLVSATEPGVCNPVHAVLARARAQGGGGVGGGGDGGCEVVVKEHSRPAGWGN